MPTSGGHVNMMDDFLINQLPAQLLKSSLRTLISQLPTVQEILLSHVREWLRANLPEKIPAERLFSPKQAEYPQYLQYIKWLFSSKLAKESLPFLTHFIDCLPDTPSDASWQNDEFKKTLTDFDADMVQAIQALKEVLASSEPSGPDIETDQLLLDLLRALESYGEHCDVHGLEYPFTRAYLQVQNIVHERTLSNHYTNGCHKLSNGLVSAISCRIIKPISIDPSKQALSQVPFTKLNSGLNIPKLLNGLWQMSSSAWGSASHLEQRTAFVKLIESGLVAADMADHYGDAELVWGVLRNCLEPKIGDRVIAISKWCIFHPLDVPVTSEFVLSKVKERCRRLRGRVELLQFHWYNYSDKAYLSIILELVKITQSHPHLVSNIGLCNFDSEHTEEVAKYLLEVIGEVGIVSNQVQFSLIDARPTIKMLEVCNKYDIKLLTYGSFLGGFISEKWLDRKSPDIYSEVESLTPSQRKYFDMIMKWGTWTDFQALLHTLQSIATKHTSQSNSGRPLTLTNVAIRWVLDHREVGSVIVGTRLGVSNHVHENSGVFGFELDAEDRCQLKEWTSGERVRRVFGLVGDCGSEYKY